MCKTGPRVASILPMQHALGELLLLNEDQISAQACERGRQVLSTCIAVDRARTCTARRLASIPEDLTIEELSRSQRSRWVSDSCVPPARPSRSRTKQKRSRTTRSGAGRWEEGQRQREPHNPRKCSALTKAQQRQSMPPKHPQRFLEASSNAS